MQPTIGRIVHYRLSAGDVAVIESRLPYDSARRNPVSEGQEFPATVTAVFGSGTTANLVVQLDGIEQYWATSRQEGEGPCTWSWPVRVA